MLAQKFYAVLNRKRNKGRDFYDIVNILGRGVLPNYDYLTKKVNIGSWTELQEAIVSHCNSLDMNEMAKNVSPFLFRPTDKKKVTFFLEYFKGL